MENIMTVSLLFRLNAAFAAMWALQLLFLPEVMFAMYEWESSPELIALGQACGCAMIALALISWNIPGWTTQDGLKKTAMTFAVISVIFLLLQLYQLLVSGAAPGNGMDWASTVITIAFAAMFYSKSR